MRILYHLYFLEIYYPTSKTISQAYAGHQFGHFTILGDGRAIILGEHLNKKNKRFDIQFKGSGKTPYSKKWRWQSCPSSNA